MIMVYTDHKNLIHKSTERDCYGILFQRLHIKEEGVQLKYIKREKMKLLTQYLEYSTYMLNCYWYVLPIYKYDNMPQILIGQQKT